MKVANIFLVSLLAVFVAGCSTKKEVHYVRENKVKTEVVTPEDDLMKYPCRAIPSGDSLIELALNYNKNVKCIKLYQIQIDKIRKDVDKKEAEHVN